MKRVIIAISIVILIIIISFSVPFLLKKYTDELIYQLDYIEYTFNNKDTDATQKETKKFIDLWDKNEEIIVSFVNHGSVDDVSYTSARLPSLLHQNDAAEFLAEIHRIKSIVCSIYEDEVPNLGNIF